jgi:hypothetical protein
LSQGQSSTSRTIFDDFDFYLFGKEVPFLAASDNNHLFTGKEPFDCAQGRRDSESGLDFFIARYYSS